MSAASMTRMILRMILQNVRGFVNNVSTAASRKFPAEVLPFLEQQLTSLYETLIRLIRLQRHERIALAS